jgi:dolichyl-phosphate beta-glucosyltransferase
MEQPESTGQGPALSIIIPAFNEERRIPNTLEKICNYFESKDHRYEILVVDDGSTDDTATCVDQYVRKCDRIKLVRNATNRGKGYSVKNGFVRATGDYLLFSDADLSTPIEEIEKLTSYLQRGYDIAIGSRGLKDSDIQLHQPLYREMMGKTFNIFVRLLSIRDFRDTQCGFKCFTKEAAIAVCKRQRLQGFCFDVEMLYIAKKLGYRIKEVPVTWRNSPETKVRALRHSANMFLDLLRIRTNAIKRKYDHNEG